MAARMRTRECLVVLRRVMIEAAHRGDDATREACEVAVAEVELVIKAALQMHSGG